MTAMGVLVERDKIASHGRPASRHRNDLLGEQRIAARLLDVRSVQLLRAELYCRQYLVTWRKFVATHCADPGNFGIIAHVPELWSVSE